VAELTGRNNEINMHRYLASQSGTHLGSDHVLAPLDHFRVHGMNGEHDVLVFRAVGPNLGAIFEEDPPLIRKIRLQSLTRGEGVNVALARHIVERCAKPRAAKRDEKYTLTVRTDGSHVDRVEDGEWLKIAQ